MKAWSTEFKQTANTFSHDDHPQTAEMSEMLIKIGKQMSELGLENLHSDVINGKFQSYKFQVFGPAPNDDQNFPPLVAPSQPPSSSTV